MNALNVNWAVILRLAQLAAVGLGLYLGELVRLGAAIPLWLTALLPVLTLVAGQSGHYADPPKGLLK